MTTEDQDKDSGGIQNSAAETRKTKGKRQRNKKKRNGNNIKGRATNSSKFIGSESGMRGHVFQLQEESKTSLQFNKTCRELIRFVASTYTQHEDVIHLIEKMEDPYIAEPPSPKSTLIKDENDPKKSVQLDPSWKEKHKYSKHYDMYLERIEEFRLNKSSLYQLIWGQCSSALKAKVKTVSDFKNIQKEKKCIELLKGIQGVMHKFETQDYLGSSF